MSRSLSWSLVGRVLETADREEMLPEGGRVLVAVSGGADSVCLFEILRIVAARRRLTLAGFHLNHRLRPAAREDERFVRALFERADVPLTVVRSDVRGYARRHRLGIEEAGRELRYRHLGRVARRGRCGRVALGHIADDHLETMILNLARGSGMTGLRGIPARRDIFVRPLIELSRAEIEQWLKARELGWREDESNRDDVYSRNLVRHRVVPVLRELNPDIVASARRTGRLLAEEDDWLEALADEALAASTRRVRAGVRIDLAAFATYNVPLRRRMVRKLIPGLDMAGVDRVLAFLGGARPAPALPGGVKLTRPRPAGTADAPAVLVTRKGGHGR